MNYICTWLCADEKGEESIFPQTGKSSSSQEHQNIYWRCLLLFYVTSRRYNKSQQHLLFTNVKKLPVVDGKDVNLLLKDLLVEVVFTDFKYKTPKDYFGMFQNQFYEFSILEHITAHYHQPDDLFMIVDSDCIFIKPAKEIFNEATKRGFMSFEDPCSEHLIIHGLSRVGMKALYEDLIGFEIDEIPGYHLGEFFLASVKNINTIFSGFLKLWPELMRRYQMGLMKFNEEAQTLSYLYYSNNFYASPKKNLMKRIWTNPVFYRNVEKSDTSLVLWHLPSEKTFGLADLYEIFVNKLSDFGSGITDKQYLAIIQNTLSIPGLPAKKKLWYYYESYYRAISKRLKKITQVFKPAY